MEDERPDGQDYSKRLGSGMVVAAWVAGLAVLTLLFGDWLDQQRNPNTGIRSRHQDGAVEVVLGQNRGHHYVASARINGMPVEVLLDTGASAVSIPADLAADMRLEREAPLRMSTANGTVTVYATTVDEVRLGDIALHDIRATINPHMQGDFVLLGMSFLKHLEFNQRDGRLILRQNR